MAERAKDAHSKGETAARRPASMASQPAAAAPRTCSGRWALEGGAGAAARHWGYGHSRCESSTGVPGALRLLRPPTTWPASTGLRGASGSGTYDFSTVTQVPG